MVNPSQGTDALPVLKYVIDTNVWIEALTRLGHSASEMRCVSRKSLKKAYENGIIVMSRATARDLDETLEKFAKAGKISKADIDAFLHEVKNLVKMTGTEKGYVLKNLPELDKCKDRLDWPFLILADCAGAYAIVSRDRKHLLNVAYKNVRVLSPEAFNEVVLPPHRVRNHI